MSGTLGIAIRRRLFGIHAREATFARRRFEPTSPDRQARLELVGLTFVGGYNAYLADQLDEQVRSTSPELQGFAVEGAAMACAILDYVTPWRRDRHAALLERLPEHRYMIYVGAGWATARLHGSLFRAVTRRDPLLGWLVADGWGFHQAYFHPTRWATGARALPESDGYARRAVDQGIGRALWFIAGADPDRVAGRIGQFAADRRGDLWSGIGLAATYAGGAPREDLLRLAELAGAHRADVAQGAAFAATARAVANNVAPHVEVASQVLGGCAAAELASVSRSLEPRPTSTTAYEDWRRDLRHAFTARVAA